MNEQLMIKEDHVLLSSPSLYKGDCLEIMKTLPEKSVDLILCDPPYGNMNGAELDSWKNAIYVLYYIW